MSAKSLQRHWLALALALAVGFLLILPAVSAKILRGVPFSSPLNIRAQDNFFYFARIQDVIDGHPTLGNAYLWEHKSKPPTPSFLGEWLLAQPLKFFNAGVIAGSIFYTFFFSVTLVILVYGCFFVLTRLRWLSLLATFFLFRGLFPVEFARAVSPQFNFIFWLSLFILSYLLIRDFENHRRRRLLTFLAAVNFALLFYLYPYYWTFYLAFFAIFALLLFLRGYAREATAVAAVAAGGLLLALPYFWMMRRAMALPEYTETLERIGMIYSYFPSGIAIVIPAVALTAVAAVLLRARIILLDRTAIFLGSGVLAAVVSMNQHVITGRNLAFSSHYYMLAVFWFVFTAAYLFRAGWVKFQESGVSSTRFRIIKWAVIAAVVMPVAVMAYTRLPDKNAWLGVPLPGNIPYLRYLPVLDWLKQNAKKDEVVYAPLELSLFIPVYTANNVYFAPHSNLSFLSTAEVLDRFLLNNFYAPIDQRFIAENVRMTFGYSFIDAAAHTRQENKVRAFLGLAEYPVISMPSSAVDLALRRFLELRQGDFEKGLKTYRVDYLIWDGIGEPEAQFDALPFLDSVAKINGFMVYQVR